MSKDRTPSARATTSTAHDTVCRTCGAPLPPMGPEGGRPRRTCSGACRQALVKKLIVEGAREREETIRRLLKQAQAIIDGSPLRQK